MIQYRLGRREISQLDHRENKAYSLVLSQLLVFIAVAMNTDGFFSYQFIRFIFSFIELRIFSMTEPVSEAQWYHFRCMNIQQKKCSCIMVVHELSINISSKQTVILFVFVSVQYALFLAPTSTFPRQESILSRQITGE